MKIILTPRHSVHASIVRLGKHVSYTCHDGQGVSSHERRLAATDALPRVMLSGADALAYSCPRVSSDESRLAACDDAPQTPREGITHVGSCLKHMIETHD